MPSYLTLSWSSIQRHTPPNSLHPGLSHLTPSLQDSTNYPKLPHPLPLSPRYIRSLTYFLTVSLTPRLPPSLPHCFTSTRNVFSTHSLPQSIPPSQTTSLPPGLILTQNPSVPPTKTHPSKTDSPLDIRILARTLPDFLPATLTACGTAFLTPSRTHSLPHRFTAINFV